PAEQARRVVCLDVDPVRVDLGDVEVLGVPLGYPVVGGGVGIVAERTVLEGAPDRGPPAFVAQLLKCGRAAGDVRDRIAYADLVGVDGQAEAAHGRYDHAAREGVGNLRLEVRVRAPGRGDREPQSSEQVGRSDRAR